MAYIYKKKTRNGEYYYLRTSVRNGDRVITKNVAYLGNNLDGAKILGIRNNVGMLSYC